MTEITPNQLELAREWAQLVGPRAAPDIGRAAAEVINALPDEWIDADELRETIEFHRDRLPHGAEEDLEALLPVPRPRTLADMDDDEREACQWMQAELDGDPEMRVVISSILPAGAHVLFKDGWISFRPGSAITPLPDLPRMVWPGEQAAEDDMSIIPPKIDTSTGHDDHVDMTPEDAPDPLRPEDVPAAELWLVEFDGKQDVAVRELPGAERPWWLMRGRRASDEEITLVSRLVPEVKA